MGREVAHPLTPELEANLERLLTALNAFRKAYGKPMVVSSGYRPAAINASVGGAKASNHVVCLACDFRDTDGALAAWCLSRLEVLESCGLWIESPALTAGWIHLQAVPPRSGARVFRP